MRKPETIEHLYLDFDGFFASVMQQAMPEIRGKPVGVIPFEVKNARFTVVIACSKEAKAAGCQNVMRVPEAQAICPDIVLVMQRPDLFRRANNALLNEIACEIPIDTVKSIDELSCRLDSRDIRDPHGLSRRLKNRIANNIGEHITCSIGFAANRMLAKIACKMDKPNGVTIWEPSEASKHLAPLPFEDIPGIGSRLEARLREAGIDSVESLLRIAAKHMRQLWGNVNGERMYYALHGYDIQAIPTSRGMYGHGRVLPPDWRDMASAREVSRLLLTKAARRMRRDGYYANTIMLWLGIPDSAWGGHGDLHCANDDHAVLAALDLVWEKARSQVPRSAKIVRIGVTLDALVTASGRQLDLFANDDHDRQKWERITSAIDHLNMRYGKRIVSIGPWKPPPGGYVGGKISYTRIPSREDFL